MAKNTYGWRIKICLGKGLESLIIECYASAEQLSVLSLLLRIRLLKERALQSGEMMRVFEITCLSCGEKTFWGVCTNPRKTDIQIGDFVMLCKCGQALAEGDYVLRILAPKGSPANGFLVHCHNCERDEHWVQGRKIGQLSIGLSESSTIGCDCGVTVWQQDDTLYYAWIDPERLIEEGEE